MLRVCDRYGKDKDGRKLQYKGKGEKEIQKKIKKSKQEEEDEEESDGSTALKCLRLPQRDCVSISICNIPSFLVFVASWGSRKMSLTIEV